LLDHEQYPADQIAAVYAERWQAEVDHPWCPPSRRWFSCLASRIGGVLVSLCRRPALAGVVAAWPGVQLGEALDLRGGPGDDPAAAAGVPACGKPAAVDPGVDRGGGHRYRGGEADDGPLVVLQVEAVAGPGAGCLGADAVLVHQAQDLVTSEPVGAFGWAQPVGVELLGDLAGVQALLGELAAAGEQPWGVRQLVQTPDRAHRLAAGLMPAGPADGDVEDRKST